MERGVIVDEMVLDGEVAPREYAQRVGERLRGIRRQKGLSLQDVEADSDQEFKASVLGAYERGERSISVPRLQRLAEFYHVPVDQLLPREGTTQEIDLRADPGREAAGVTIDLARLEHLESDDTELVRRYVAQIQVQRQDFNGRMLSIRRDDLVAVGCMLGIDATETIARLNRSELLLPR